MVNKDFHCYCSRHT